MHRFNDEILHWFQATKRATKKRNKRINSPCHVVGKFSVQANHQSIQ